MKYENVRLSARWMVVVSLALMPAWTTAANAQTKDFSEYSLFEVEPFAGYQFYHKGRVENMENGVLAGVRFSWDFHKYFGLETGYTYGKDDALFIPSPTTSIGFDAHTHQLAVNPVLHFTPRGSRVRPFVTAGPAAMWFRAGTDSLSVPAPGAGSFTYSIQNKVEPALIYGGGIKFRIMENLGARVDVRGLWTKPSHFGISQKPTGPIGLYSPRNYTDDALQLTAGLIFYFGHRKPPAPPAQPEQPKPPVTPPTPAPEFAITGIVGAHDVCQGETLELRATTTNVPADARYEWTTNGQALPGQSSMATISTANLSGSQEVVLRVIAGGVTKTSEPVRFSVKGAGPLSVTFPPPQSPLTYGDKTTLSASASEPEGCPGTPRLTYTASEGTVTGNTYDSSTVQFDPRATRRQEKTVTLTANATDDRGKQGSATANVVVVKSPTARRLDDLVFAKGSARVNNCAKRVLLEVLTPLLREDPNGTVVLIGHRDTQETGRAAERLDRQRVLNAAAVISAGTGICPQLDLSRVKVKWVGTDQTSQTRPSFCGASTAVKERAGSAVSESDARAQYRRVEVWYIPAGASAPTEAGNAATAPAAEVKKLGCPR